MKKTSARTLYIVIEEGGTPYGLPAEPLNHRVYASEAVAKAQMDPDPRTQTLWEVAYDPDGEDECEPMRTSNDLRVGDRVRRRKDETEDARGTVVSIHHDGDWEIVMVEWDDGDTSPYFSRNIIKAN